MTWVSFVAIYFIIWWLVLFAVLPIGLHTQQEEGEVTLGTTSSAPRGPHMRRAIVLTTLISLAIFAAFYFVTVTLGLSVDDIPRIVPEFE